MARTFRRPRQTAPISDLNLTNLIDLGFTLLIIFMIATPLINQEQSVQVDLPVESKRPQTPPPSDTVFETIVIRADGAVQLGDIALPMDQLKTALARFAAQPKPPVFRIRMDAKATAQNFVSVMDALKQNNLSKVSFDTQTPGD